MSMLHIYQIKLEQRAATGQVDKDGVPVSVGSPLESTVWWSVQPLISSSEEASSEVRQSSVQVWQFASEAIADLSFAIDDVVIWEGNRYNITSHPVNLRTGTGIADHTEFRAKLISGVKNRGVNRD